MMNFGFILGFRGGDYMRKQNKPTVINATDEVNLADERWRAIPNRTQGENYAVFTGNYDRQSPGLPACSNTKPACPQGHEDAATVGNQSSGKYDSRDR